MNSKNLGPGSTKDKPIIATGPAGHPQLTKMPEWPASTIALLSTIDGGPREIPVAAHMIVGFTVSEPSSPHLSAESLSIRRRHAHRWKPATPYTLLSSFRGQPVYTGGAV